MKALLVALAAAIIVAAAIVAFAPAALVDERLAIATAGRVRLAHASGTVLRGRGSLTDASGAARIPVEWRLDPIALARGEIAVQALPAGADGMRGRLTAFGDRLVANDIVVALPMIAVVAMAGTPPSIAGGDVAIDSKAFTLDPTSADGALAAQWRRARIVVPSGAVVELGTVDMRLAARGAELTGPLTARGGEVVADGTVAVTPRSVRLDVELVAVADAPPAVRDALAVLGPVDGRGAVRWRLARERR